MIRAFTLIFSLIAATLFGWERHNSEGFAAEAALSSDSVPITDTIKLSLKLTAPPDYTVNSQALTNNLLEYSETTDSSFKLINVQRAENTLTYTLEPLDPGVHTLTFRDITFTAANKPAVMLLSGVLSVTVTAIDENTPLAVADVLPLENRPILTIDAENEQQLDLQAAEQPNVNRRIFLDRSFPWHYLVLFPMAVLLVVGSIRLLIRIAKDLSKLKREATPAETASQSLQALATSDLVAKGDFESFYIQLTKTLRDYIAARYGIAAPEMTTEEFMQAAAANNNFDSATRDALNDLLAYADQVKFAKQPTTPEDCATALSYAETFIQTGQGIN